MAEKILVVDDDLDTLKLVGMMLERQGFVILAASTGRQALTLARAEKPALIVLDLMMPDIDGIQVTRQLRADPETRDILILMFTARTQMDDKLEGYDAGADDYLAKPIQPRELIAHVRAVLKRSGKSAAPPAAVRERGQQIALIAPKGGVGVSTLALNTGIALHAAGRIPVLVADFRPGFGTIGLELGISDAQGLNRLLALSPAAITPETIEPELVEHAGLRLLLSSGDPLDTRNSADEERFAALARQLPYLAAYSLLDLGAGLTAVNLKALAECLQVVLVLEPVGQTVTQARKMHDRLVENGISEDCITPALVNRQRAGMQLSLGQVQDQFGYPITHVFTAAPELVYQSQTAHAPVVLRQPDGVTAQQFNALAQKLLQPVR